MGTPAGAMMTPPPGADGDSATPQSGLPTTPLAASPAPAQPSPMMNSHMSTIGKIVEALRGIAKAYPATSPEIQEINDKIRTIGMKIMESSQPGESQAPPG